MTIRITSDKGHVPVKVWTEDIEPEALHVEWAQNYAMLSRRHMLTLILDAVKRELGGVPGSKIQSWNMERGDANEAISCHHNYVEQETHFGEHGIIPGSMGATSYIVRGLGPAGPRRSGSHAEAGGVRQGLGRST